MTFVRTRVKGKLLIPSHTKATRESAKHKVSMVIFMYVLLSLVRKKMSLPFLFAKNGKKWLTNGKIMVL